MNSPEPASTASLSQPAEKPTEEANSIDKIGELTRSFRSNLPIWEDQKGDRQVVVVDGVNTELLHADALSVSKYARAFTEIWLAESDMMKVEMKDLWFIDCRGLYIDDSVWVSTEDRRWAPVRFDKSTLASPHLFDRQVFLGSTSFHEAVFDITANFESTEFQSWVDFDLAVFRRDANFRRARFLGPSSFQRLKAISGNIDFSRATFHRAPRFHETKLPQGTSFDGADFVLNANQLLQSEIEQDSLAFRTLKQAANGYRGQQDEADFFALEQMMHRKRYLAPHLEWNVSTWREPKIGLRDLVSIDTMRSFREWEIRARPLEWILSLLYDLISNYGRSAGRALTCFIVVNLALTAIFRFGYTFGDCAAATSSYCAPSALKSSFALANPATQLTLQNLLNPAALATEKAVVTVHDPTLISASIFQSVFSYLVLFLAALAIRTRFQKGGGGNS